jgi:hypothetical protein
MIDILKCIQKALVDARSARTRALPEHHGTRTHSAILINVIQRFSVVEASDGLGEDYREADEIPIEGRGFGIRDGR